jgi:hypothetical protein
MPARPGAAPHWVRLIPTKPTPTGTAGTTSTAGTAGTEALEVLEVLEGTAKTHKTRPKTGGFRFSFIYPRLSLVEYSDGGATAAQRCLI